MTSHQLAYQQMRALRPKKGLSIVELMIGIAIGLFILAGASLVMTTQLNDNRRMLLETQMQQDLRASAALISRDIRRAAYWGKSYTLVGIKSAVSSASNPYQEMSPRNTDASSTLTYDRSLDDDDGVVGRDNNVVSGSERVQFSLNDTTHAIMMRLGNADPQALTDANVLKVTNLSFSVSSTQMPVPCGAVCPKGSGEHDLVYCMRTVSYVIEAEAKHDASVKRSIRDAIRLRNDILRETAC